jgi:ferric-dicitrate binding protein FerR (iron transport regulator)
MMQWRVAAAVLISFCLIGFFVMRPFGGEAFGGVVQAAEGTVYRVADEDSRAIINGEAVKANESIRTARGAHASFKLADGSLVEMRERSQFHSRSTVAAQRSTSSAATS